MSTALEAPALSLPAESPAATLAPARASARGDRAKLNWLAALLAAICFEGLGRKYLSAVPSAAFYFAKDAVLVVGAFRFGIRPSAARASSRLFGHFRVFIPLAVIWTTVEMFNPDQVSVWLGLLGERAYWLWWLAPLVIAGVLTRPEQITRLTKWVVALCGVVAFFAIRQYFAPAESAVNQYALYNGQEVLKVATVTSTGHARVSSTFSFMVGFVDFGLMVPPLLIALGQVFLKGRARMVAFATAGICLATLPMSGSRGSVVLGAAVMMVMLMTMGIVRSSVGRQLMVALAAAAFVAVTFFPSAFEGVRTRFELEDTQDRFLQAAQSIPGVQMFTSDFPIMGVGTGMQQNFRFSFGDSDTRWYSEGEPGRYLIELGAFGYLLLYILRTGLSIALWRFGRRFSLLGCPALGGVARAYALVQFQGALVFDHVFNALFFTCVGILLATYIMLNERARPEPTLASAR